MSLAATLATGIAGALALTVAGPTAMAAAATTAGNGIDSLSPAAVLARSASALRSQPNIVVSGTVVQGGATTRVDLRASAHGSKVAGTLTSDSEKLGFTGTIHLVSLPGALYLNGGRGLWQKEVASSAGLSASQRQRLLNLLTAHWIKLTGASASTSSFQSFTPSALANSMTKDEGTLTEGAPVVVRGVSTLPIHSSKGATVYIARSGPPLPLEARGTGGGGAATGSVAVSYPKALTITAPAGAITLAQVEASL